VIIMPNILNPFPNIAGHVVKTEGIRLEGANRRRLLVIPFAAAAIAIGIALAWLIAPGIAGRCASPRGALPFGLYQKPARLDGEPREPPYILLGIVPTHIDDRHPPAPPLILDLRARPGRGASVPLRECHLIFGNGEGLGDPHLALRTFVCISAGLV